MSEFKAIETQEQLDEIIKARLERQERTITERFGDYESLKESKTDLEKQIADLNDQIAKAKESASGMEETINTLRSQVKGYETDSLKTRIALETGLPYDFASRLQGDDEDSLRKDAETLSKNFKTTKVPPLANTEPPLGDDKTQAMKSMLKDLRGE